MALNFSALQKDKKPNVGGLNTTALRAPIPTTAPFESTALGVATGTLLGIPRELGRIGQEIARNIASAGVTIGKQFGGVEEVTPPQGLEFLFRDEPIKSIEQRIVEAEPKVVAFGRKQEGSALQRGFGTLLADNPELFAFIGVMGSVGIDLTPFGGLEKNAFKAIKKINNAGDALRILKQMNVEDDIARNFVDDVVKVSTTKEAKALMTSIAELQRTTRAVGLKTTALQRPRVDITAPRLATEEAALVRRFVTEVRTPKKALTKLTNKEFKEVERIADKFNIPISESRVAAANAFDDALVGAQQAEKETLERIFSGVETKVRGLIEKQERRGARALDNALKKHGNTDRIISTLRTQGVSRLEIDNIILETGDKLVDTVKVKRENNGVLSAVITKKDLADIERTFTDIKDKNIWVRNDTLTFKTRKVARGLQEMYELPQVFWTRTGLKKHLYTPIRDAEDNAELMKRSIFKRFEEAGLMKERGIFIADRFTISKKEAEHVSDYYLTIQNKKKGLQKSQLSKKESQFVDMFDEIKKEHEPRFFRVARKNGKNPGKVENYSPLYTKGELTKGEEVGHLDFIFRRHPAFASLKRRVDDVPVELYETDYRKVVGAWVNGISNFTHLGDEVGQVKHLVGSDEFLDLVGDRVHRIAHNWLRDITTPKPLSTVENISRFGRKVTALASLGLSYASVLKQSLTLVPIMIINKALPKRKSVFAKAFGISVKDMPSITQRGGDIAIADMQQGISRAFLGPLVSFDRKNAQVALNGLLDKEYKKFLKTGKTITKETEQIIINEARDIMEMWFGGMTKSQLPPAFRSEVGKAINMFIYPLTSQLNGFLFHVAKAKGMKKPIKIAEAITALITIAYMEQVITALSPQWSDKKEMVTDVLKSFAGNIPLINQIIYAYATENPLNLLTATTGISNTLKKVNRFTKGQATELDVAFALAEMFGLPKTARRLAEGTDIYSEGGIRDKTGKLLAPITETDHIRTFLRGKYGSIAGRDYIRNIGVKTEDRRWFVPEVEFLQNGDYDRKAELYNSFDIATQETLRAELSEGQQKLLDKALNKVGQVGTSLESIFGGGGRTLESIFE